MDRRFQAEVLPDIDWAELRRRVLHAEELGFDLATTADQYVDWKNSTVPWFDLWATLSALTEATNTIRLAPCVAQIPMRDPATLARQVLTVDHVSGGRVEAALGLGLTVDPGYNMIGAPNWDNPERAARFGEYVQIVDQLLSTARCSFAGDYSVDAGADELLADATSLKVKMAKASEQVDRNPDSLRHSFLLFDGDARAQGGRLFY
jgi:alkanesulfonate monooxygenase SsuD/methylene tetrahydromethanopterin reductase-like flavin-dependent oxidoreductase (luciferase family)